MATSIQPGLWSKVCTVSAMWGALRSKIFTNAWYWRVTDALAVGLAMSLPWSTSATSIFAILFLAIALPGVDWASYRRILTAAPGGVPFWFWIGGLVGMLWAANVPLADRFDAWGGLHKLGMIPLLIFHFERSKRGAWVLAGFLVSCTVLLAVSWFLALWPDLAWRGRERPGGLVLTGVPVKDYITQSAEFVACAFILAGIALADWQRDRRRRAIALLVLSGIFLANLLYVTSSRTALASTPVLVLLLACRYLPWPRVLATGLAIAVAAPLAWWLAPPVRTNLSALLQEVTRFEPDAEATRAGRRLEYWKKSVGIIADAPLIGHGTGSIREQFRATVAGRTGMAAEVAADPHNQVLTVAIQWGLAGTVFLIALWAFHLLLFFRRSDLIGWIGLTIVTQNIIGSLFNSHLFDFAAGWGYALGVGVAAGMASRMYRSDES